MGNVAKCLTGLSTKETKNCSQRPHFLSLCYEKRCQSCRSTFRKVHRRAHSDTLISNGEAHCPASTHIRNNCAAHAVATKVVFGKYGYGLSIVPVSVWHVVTTMANWLYIQPMNFYYSPDMGNVAKC